MFSKVLIFPAIVACFWVFRIFFLKTVCREQLFVVASMLAMVLSIFGSTSFALFIFPFCYLAIRQNTSTDGISKWDCLIFLPPVLIVPLGITLVFRIFLYAQIIAISIWAIIVIRRYDKKIAEFFDTSADNTADEISQVGLGILFSVSLVIILVNLPEHIASNVPVRIIFALFLTALQLYVGFHTYNIKENRNITAEVAKGEEEEAELENAEGDADGSENGNGTAQADTEDRLTRQIIEDKLYLDPSASLVSLAQALHTNRTYLSRSIHKYHDQNFSEFINMLRTRHFLELVKAEGRNINIKEAAMQSGYSSMQSFYRNFSEIMEMTPKTWISRNFPE